jgi:acyl-CoA synthetase (AMP-forming)/AMP-acid ligase II
MHSQGNLLAFASNVAEYLQARATDRVLGLLPISFSYGLNQLLTTLCVGGHLVLQKAPFPVDVVRSLADNQITGFAAVPSLWSQLLDYLDKRPTSLPSLRYVTNAGDAISEANARRLRRHLPKTDIVLMYGSTEALRTSYLAPGLFDKKMGSIGNAIPNAEVFVVGENGRVCGPGEQGELVQRGAQVSQGYWNNPAETSRRFRRCSALPGESGTDPSVYHSGDIVRIDEDGLLWFVSRADWMVKSGGFRFSIEDVERLLLESGLVGEVAAFSLPDESRGQVVNVAVTRRAGGSLDPAELERYCFKAMPSHMIPRAFHLVEELPVLGNGKRDREALRRQIAGTASRGPGRNVVVPSPARDAC